MTLSTAGAMLNLQQTNQGRIQSLLRRWLITSFQFLLFIFQFLSLFSSLSSLKRWLITFFFHFLSLCFNPYQVAENQRPSDDVEAAATKLDKKTEDPEKHASKLEQETDHLEASLGVFIGPEREPVGFVELDRSKPTMEKIYPSLKNKYADAEKRKYDKKDWPSKDECKKFVSRYVNRHNLSHSKEYT